MRKHRGISTLVALAALLLIPSTAAAAGVTGDDCIAKTLEPNATAVVLDDGGLDPEPLASGVITRWKVQVPAGQAPVEQRLVLFGQPLSFHAQGQPLRKSFEGPIETVRPGQTEFATRISVHSREGVYIGLTGPAGALLCEQPSGNLAGIVEGAWAVNEARSFDRMPPAGVPLTVIVEPDRDGDGYGDETQDGCPAGPAHQGPCPPLKLELNTGVKPGAIMVLARVDSEATLEVLGTVKRRALSKDPQARRPKGPRVIRFSAGPPRAVPTGFFKSFRLPLPKAVLRGLASLPPERKVRVRIVVRATDSLGRTSKRRLGVILRGRS